MYNILILAGAIASAASFIDSFKNFATNCTDNEFFCGNFECVPLTKQCDGTPDCSDASDERNCELYHCKQPHFFKCKNSRCISAAFVCDEENDCDDYSDEENCEEFKKKLQQRNVTCGEDEWQCTNKLCIPKEWKCNGETDCPDGSDEVLGCSHTIDCDDGFKCKNGHCIFQEWKCDGHDDCRDNSDEENCEASVNRKDCTLEEGRFLCADGKTCIKLSQVCDDRAHCPDKSDEGSSCWKSCDHCSHHCLQLPTGPKCMCPSGYRTIDERRCEDINECETYGLCDQKCKNTPGSYQCYCEENYSLQSDRKTCKAHFGEAIMYFSSSKEIRAYFLRSEIYFSVAKDLNRVVGVDSDGDHVYWTDIHSEHESIVRSTVAGERKELLVTAGLGAPEDLHVDYVTKNIYFTDAERQHIGVCTNDGNHCTVLVNQDIYKPRGIVLNPLEGEMYWTDWGHNPVIARSLMDGTNAVSFVHTEIQWPNGLVIDHPNSRLYWTDAKLMTIESIRLDGTDRRTVLHNIVKHPYAIAVFENRLYWSDWATHSIQSCDKFTGKNHRTLVKDRKGYITGIAIYHPNNHKELKNPCMKAQCSDICLLSGNTYSCACPQDKEMGVDGRTCREVEKKQRLVLGTESMLLEVQHQVLGRHQVEPLSAVIVKKIGALAYNSVENLIYVSDLDIRKIIQVDLHTRMAKVINVGDVGVVIAMDYDYLGNNLYWCDSERGTVEIYSFNTDSRTILLHDMKGEVPESIALVPEEGIMFVAFRKSDFHVSHVDRVFMDGTSRTHPLEFGLLGPISLSYDFTLHRVFVADAGTGNIESTSVEGDDRHGFKSLQTSPISITTLKSDVFWVNKHSKDVYWADKFNGGDVNYNRKLTLGMIQDNMHIVSITPRRIGLSPCQNANAGCSHLCLQSQNKIVCACPIGLHLDGDNKTCIERTECTPNDFFCSKSNICILRSLRCDNIKHCPFGEDESDCQKPNHCPLNYFQCRDGECIPEEQKCNSMYDCRDKSDEHNCSHVEKRKCPPNHFRCKNDQCINERLVCDGVNDCVDEEDEANCVNTICRDKEFRCASGACIPKEWECDHDFDCRDFSDEHPSCPKCAPSQFWCNNGKCIDKSFVCDSENDCGDHSDELSCSSEPLSCKEDEFSCSLRSSTCLPKTALCNGTTECPNHEDEQNCSHQCKEYEFSCKNLKCIPKEWVCDRSDDCGDGTDEEKWMCNHTVPHQSDMPSCKDKYQCKNGKCVDFELVCNGVQDCFDGSDEEGVCNTSCNILNNPCSQICAKTPTGPMCKCEEGFYLLGDGKTCEDLDECEKEPPVCGQICHNIPGFYLCDCYQGFVLRSDRTSCKAESKAMSLIYVAENQIREMSQMKNSLELIHKEDGPKITGLDVSTSGDVYFSLEDSGALVKIDRSNSKTEFIEQLNQPQKLSLDWLTNNIYYFDNAPLAKSISVCNFKAKACASLLFIDLRRQVSAISVDARNKFLFYSLVSWWMFNSPNYVIYKTNLDGTAQQELIKSTAGYITGLTFDPYKKQLYFVDQHHGQLHRIDYDGSRKTTILSNLTRPNGLNFFENQVFFQSFNLMEKCRLYAPLSCDSFKFKSEIFAIVQQSKQPTGDNPCVNHTCSHLCVAAKFGYKCLCEDGKVVSADEHCDPTLRSSDDESRRRVLAIHHHEHYSSSHPGPTIAAVMIFICLLTFGGFLFYVIKKRNSGTFNVISMRFSNPGYGLHNDDAEKSILEPGQHEYTNPVELYEDNAQKEEKVLINV